MTMAYVLRSYDLPRGRFQLCRKDGAIIADGAVSHMAAAVELAAPGDYFWVGPADYERAIAAMPKGQLDGSDDG